MVFTLDILCRVSRINHVAATESIAGSSIANVGCSLNDLYENEKLQQ